MVAFNIGNGLSSLGSSVAQTAGTMQLEAQKADLENQKEALASQLAEGRETRLAGVTAGYAATAAQAKSAADIALARTTSELRVGETAQEAKDASDLAVKLGNDPANLAALRNIASTDPVKIAQANELGAQAALANIQTDSAKKVLTARQAIIDEQSKPTPDPAKLASLQQSFSTLMTDPAAASAMRMAAVTNARVNEDAAARNATDLNAALAKAADPAAALNPDVKAQLQTNIENLQRRQNTLNAAADDARKQANSLFGGAPAPNPAAPPTSPGGAPDLSKYLKTPGGATMPPSAATPGLINAPGP